MEKSMSTLQSFKDSIVNQDDPRLVTKLCQEFLKHKTVILHVDNNKTMYSYFSLKGERVADACKDGGVFNAKFYLDNNLSIECETLSEVCKLLRAKLVELGYILITGKKNKKSNFQTLIEL